MSELQNLAPPTSLDELYRRHHGWLVKFMRARFRQLPAEDVVQEAFLRTLRSGSKIANPKAFLATVAIRAALAEVRRRPEVGFEYRPEEVVEPEAEQMVLLEQALAALPGPIREVFLLSRFGGLSNVEIAERCHLSVKRVEARLTEGRKRLAALIAD